MEFKIFQRFDPVTLIKESQLCKAKQLFKETRQQKDNRQHKNKIDKFFPILQLHLQS